MLDKMIIVINQRHEKSQLRINSCLKIFAKQSKTFNEKTLWQRRYQMFSISLNFGT